MRRAIVWLVRLAVATLLILGMQPVRLLHAEEEAFILPEGKVGALYEYRIQTEGGLPPLNWKLVAGELPPGVELQPSGTLRGVPTAARREPYEFTVEVSDSSQPPQTFSQPFRLLIQPAPLRIVLAAHPLKILPPQHGEAGAASTTKAGGGSESSRAGSAPVGRPTNGDGNKPSQPAPPAIPTAPAPKTNEVQGLASSAAAPDPAGTGGRCRGVIAPAVDIPLLQGRSLITGCASKTATMVKVTVHDAKGNQVILKEGNVEPNTGEFLIELPQRLKKDDRVTVQQFESANWGTESPKVVVLGRTYDAPESEWGRIRPYFSAGVIFSKENNDFSKQDLYVGFNLDKNWHKGEHFLWNTYFDARLTSIPVAAQPSQQTTSMGSGTGSSSGSTTQVETFIGSRKAALLQGGLYFPMYAESWKWWYDGNNNALFIAPIIKAGFQTVTSGTQMTTSPAPGSNFLTQTLQNRDFYHFWAAGVRLGHFKLYDSWNIAPELISYLDITIGQWQNFAVCPNRQCAVDPNTGLAQGPFDHPLRFAFEGRLKIPGVPLQIGFDANTGPERADLRFLFGTQFDVGCAFRKLRPKPGQTAQPGQAITGCEAEKPTAQKQQ